MGSRSVGGSWPYVRSLIRWFLPWLLITGVVVFAAFAAADFGSNGANPSASLSTKTPSPSPSPTPSPSPEPSETATAEPTPEPSEAIELITEGITAQVLNGSSDDTAGDRIADELAELGYEIASVGDAANSYEITTVFYSEGFEEAATALGEYFDWTVEPKVENLSDEINLHVVVGEDEATA